MEAQLRSIKGTIKGLKDNGDKDFTEIIKKVKKTKNRMNGMVNKKRRRGGAREIDC